MAVLPATFVFVAASWTRSQTVLRGPTVLA